MTPTTTTEISLENGIAQVKRRFPLPLFLLSRGLGEHAHRSARCLFHDDQRNSFSVFPGHDGDWRWKCHAGCGGGDAIDLICKLDKVPFKIGLQRYRKESESAYVLGLVSNNSGWQRQIVQGPPAPRESQSETQSSFNWPECVQELAYDGALINRLAKGRGYDPATIWTLLQHELIGQFERHFAFPVMTNCDQGRVIGCHYVLPDTHEWRYTPGCSATPLLLGNGTEYHATESTWDAIALIDQLGFEGVTVVVTRGSGNAARIADCIPPNIVVRLWPQNDQAGQKWVYEAKRTLSATAICTTPPQFKDVNEWFLNS
jgi:hypothetical protein